MHILLYDNIFVYRTLFLKTIIPFSFSNYSLYIKINGIFKWYALHKILVRRLLKISFIFSSTIDFWTRQQYQTFVISKCYT